MRSRHYAILGILFAVVVLSAMANVLTSASATADCSGFTLTVNAGDLSAGTEYTVDYSFILTCNGTATTVSGSTSFTATAATQSHTATVSWPTTPLTANCTVTGTATLTSSGSTVTIVINGSTSATLTCGGTACPATIGYWKHHAFPASVDRVLLSAASLTRRPTC